MVNDNDDSFDEQEEYSSTMKEIIELLNKLIDENDFEFVFFALNDDENYTISMNVDDDGFFPISFDVLKERYNMSLEEKGVINTDYWESRGIYLN